jgi:hypothetical protein
MDNPIRRVNKRGLLVKCKDFYKKRIVKDGRKSGAILIEFLVAIPVFMLLLWGITNVMVYMLASTNLNEAAYEASRALAKEMRGHEGAIESPLHTDDVPMQVTSVTNQNNFVHFGKNGHPATFAYESSVVVAGQTANTCANMDTDENEKNYLCAYVVRYPSSSGRTLEQVVVIMKSEFNMIGSMIPGLAQFVPLRASSVAQKELPGRYDYVD